VEAEGKKYNYLGIEVAVCAWGCVEVEDIAYRMNTRGMRLSFYESHASMKCERKESFIASYGLGLFLVLSTLVPQDRRQSGT